MDFFQKPTTMYPVARISKRFGSEGEVLVNLYPDFPDDFDPAADPLFTLVDRLTVPLYCDRFERRGRSSALVRFADLDTERRVEEFLGCELCIEEADEEESDEFYMEDLIGFAVEANGCRGEVTDYYDSEANPLFELELEGRRVLVPAVEEFFAHIDFEGRELKLVLPDGLLEL